MKEKRKKGKVHMTTPETRSSGKTGRRPDRTEKDKIGTKNRGPRQRKPIRGNERRKETAPGLETQEALSKEVQCCQEKNEKAGEGTSKRRKMGRGNVKRRGRAKPKTASRMFLETRIPGAPQRTFTNRTEREEKS